MKILLLEDEKQIAENIKEYLELKKGWNVKIVSNLKEAKQEVEKIIMIFYFLM